MIRLFVTTSLLALAAPAFADTITGQARVDTVTIYPGLATVTRLVTLDLPAGQHDIIIPDLPQGLSADGLRIAAPAQVRLGAVNLAFDRLPVTPDQSSPAILAARAEVDRLEEVLRESDTAIAAIRLRAQAAEDQIAFLQSLGQASAGESLTTGDDPQLDIDRAVVISQATGQDWLDVQLVLSTARPGDQIAPGGAWAELRHIISEDALAGETTGMADAPMPLQRNSAVMAAPMMDTAPITAQADFSGVAVTYVYLNRIDIRNGVEDLRLPLDQLSFDTDVWAEATPMTDANAYRMAEFTNTTDEILLPGRAMLHADGTMIGFSHLPLLAAGADLDIGFGPLDGLRLTRITPDRSTGDRGVFSSSNQLVERTVLTVENLTGQDWDVLLRDAVPYSEQDDLQVSLTAVPEPTRRDRDGARGIVEWDLSVPAGAEQEVVMETTLRWPSGYVLR